MDQADVTLARAAQSGDKAAFAALLQRHWPLLLGLCRRALDDPDLAHDAAQEAAIQALLSLHQLRRPERFGPWLAGIGLNICRWWRRERLRDFWSWDAFVGGHIGPEPRDRRPTPEEQAIETDLARTVRDAVATLPEGQRAAILLFYLQGMTLAETAALLGIEVGAVKTRLHKARTTLRRRLWELWKEERMPVEATPASRLIEMRIVDVWRQSAQQVEQLYAAAGLERPGPLLRSMAMGQSNEPLAGADVIVLEEQDGSRRFPVWVNWSAGTLIALRLEKMQYPRPLADTFALSLVTAVGSRLREVRLAKLVDQVLHAEIVVEGPAGIRTVDARPQDALSLAVLAEVPVLVAEQVLTRGGVEGQPPGRDSPGGAAEIAGRVASRHPRWQPPTRLPLEGDVPRSDAHD